MNFRKLEQKNVAKKSSWTLAHTGGKTISGQTYPLEILMR